MHSFLASILTAGAALSQCSSAAPTASTSTFWKPSAGATWQIQLTGSPIDTSVAADVYDIDLFDNDHTTISAIQGLNRKVICYFSAGTFEDWRSDAGSFTEADKGGAMDDWGGEWWLNTNSENVRSIMTERIEQAKNKGCDAIDPDNMDAYNNSDESGLDLTTDDAVDYMRFLADAAHSRGLAIGLKNAGDIVEDVLPFVEFEVNEQCVLYNECDAFEPFLAAGKPVFHIEYPDGAPSINPKQRSSSCHSPSGFSTLMKTIDLDAWLQAC